VVLVTLEHDVVVTVPGGRDLLRGLDREAEPLAQLTLRRLETPRELWRADCLVEELLLLLVTQLVLDVWKKVRLRFTSYRH
jgi:hypothetical protein